MKNRVIKQKGIALFIAILMSLSIALLSAASATKAQQATRVATAHQKQLQLRLFATESAKLALANIQSQINIETAVVENNYTIGGSVFGSYIFYPNAPGGAKKPLFGYRAKAILVGVPGERLPSMSSSLAADHYCFDIVADAREVVELPPSAFGDAGNKIAGAGNFYWGRSKNVGMIACIPRQLNQYWWRNKEMRKKLLLFIVGFVFALSMTLVGEDASLKDDVFTMVKQAKKIVHTMFLMDTSEQMNTFAYSDYITTCADTRHKIDSSHAMCMASYHQCRDAENNAACSVDLGCDDIAANCADLLSAKTKVNEFCDKVEASYPEPSLTATANPVTEPVAKKYVGPWNPETTYELDLCFYNWTADTGGEVISGTNSQHPSNNAAGETDRRDWDCITDGTGGEVVRGGLWLNWKYATSLDAMKIVIADTHQFAYTPKIRGTSKCVRTDYTPRHKDDAATGQVTCYSAEFETTGDEDLYTDADVDAAPITERERAEEIIKDEWIATKTDEGSLSEAACIALPPGEFDVASTIATSDAGSMGCDICKDPKGFTIPCEGSGEIAAPATDIQTISLTTSVKMFCCATFNCVSPACRDDDSCDAATCTLGYYSVYDQDQNHCCNDLICEEPRNEGDCDSGGAQFVPGPTSSREASDSATFSITGLGADETYSSVNLTVTLDALTLAGPHSITSPTTLPAVTLRIFSGCFDSDPSVLIATEEYDTNITTPGVVILTALPLSGCDDVDGGYAVKAMITLSHNGDPASLDDDIAAGENNSSEATATADIHFELSYALSKTGSIDVLNISTAAFAGHGIEVDPATVVVNEYECRTTSYALQSYVQSGRASNCNYSKMTKPDGSPFEYCGYPNHKTIDADQWGNVKKTLCTWLCSQDPEYTDAWACKEFFEQMDGDTRNGPGDALITCDSTHTIEQCCASVHTNFAMHSPAYRVFTPCQTVGFSGGNYKCCMAGFQQGVNDGEYFFTGGNQTEILLGHIQEAGGGAYRLSDSPLSSPYESDNWYSAYSLIGKSDSFITNTYVSLFRTAASASERSTACVYDIVQTAYGEDCDPCSGGGACCEVETSSSIDYCDYPTFWVKIPKSEGGHLVLPAAHLTGAAKMKFQTAIKNFKGVGGATLGETLYDMWRYIGGMAPLHDDFSQMAAPPATYYASPIQTDPDCFINNTVIVSGGSPQFDSNFSIVAKAGAGYSDPNRKPYVTEDDLDPDPAYITNNEPPKYIHDFYTSALAPSSMPATFPDGSTTPDRDGGVASFVHTVDSFHSLPSCRLGSDWTLPANGYAYGAYGYNTAPCNDASDATGLNVIDAIHTVAIGGWALGTLYDAGSGYLDNELLRTAASDGGGNFYALSADPDAVDGTEIFEDLTELFNALEEGTPLDIVAGMPHFTTSFIQPFIDKDKTFGPESYLPVTLPIDNSISRFWFGNLKKYYFNSRVTSGCYITNDNGVGFGAFSNDQLLGDCFTPGSDEAVSTLLKRTFNKGAYLKLLAQLDPCSGDGTSTNPCFSNNTFRHIYYDDTTTLIEIGLTTSATVLNDLSTQMSLTTAETSKVVDYLYGYDVYDDDNDGSTTDKRDAIVTVLDPDNVDFASAATINVKMSILGAIVHSNPIAVHYNSMYSTRIYFGAADGMMHAFTQDGDEAWAYLPSPVLPKMSFIADKTAGLKYESTVDGPIAFLHFDNPSAENGIVNTGEKAYIIFGYRRGARAYTVVDVSDPDIPQFVQHIYTGGESWGKPLLFTRGGTQYMAITGGYDPCFDADIPSCPSPNGNSIHIYKFDHTATPPRFVTVKTYNKATTAAVGTRNTEWFRAPFAADGVKINITEEDSSDADFIYFVDISGSVFRIDTRGGSPNTWRFRLVFRNRSGPTISTWVGGFRSYHTFSLFPPRKQYLTGLNDDSKTVMPIPMITGSLVNPGLTGEPNKAFVFYDLVDPDVDTAETFINYVELTAVHTGLQAHTNNFLSGTKGWIVPLDSSPSRKIINRPLVYYDKDDTEMWYFAWTSFAPASFGECKNAGRGYAYFRMLSSGTDVPNEGKWDDIAGNNSHDLGEGKPTDMTTMGSSQTGSLPAAGAGDEQFTIQGFELTISAPASYLKWYELY